MPCEQCPEKQFACGNNAWNKNGNESSRWSFCSGWPGPISRYCGIRYSNTWTCRVPFFFLTAYFSLIFSSPKSISPRSPNFGRRNRHIRRTLLYYLSQLYHDTNQTYTFNLILAGVGYMRWGSWRIQTVPGSDDHPHPSDNLKDVWEERGEGAERRDWRREKAEWRENWAIIHDGVVSIFRNPNVRDLFIIYMFNVEPTFFLGSKSKSNLSPSPVSRGSPRSRIPPPPLIPCTPNTVPANFLCEANSAPHIFQQRRRRQQELCVHVAWAFWHQKTLPKKSETAKGQRKTSDKEPKQKAHSLKKSQKVGTQLYSTTSSPSLRNPGQDRQPHPTSSRTSSSRPKSPLHITGENPKEKEEKPGKTLRETDSF